MGLGEVARVLEGSAVCCQPFFTPLPLLSFVSGGDTCSKAREIKRRRHRSEASGLCPWLTEIRMQTVNMKGEAGSSWVLCGVSRVVGWC